MSDPAKKQIAYRGSWENVTVGKLLGTLISNKILLVFRMSPNITLFCISAINFLVLKNSKQYNCLWMHSHIAYHYNSSVLELTQHAMMGIVNAAAIINQKTIYSWKSLYQNNKASLPHPTLSKTVPLIEEMLPLIFLTWTVLSNGHLENTVKAIPRRVSNLWDT